MRLATKRFLIAKVEQLSPEALKLLSFKREVPMQVFVRDNNVDQALKVLKKKMQREGLFRELKRRAAYEKPSERKAREKAEAIRRTRKLARKKAQREGLLPAPKPKEKPVRRPDTFRSLDAAGANPPPEAGKKPAP